jgi:hypothetical protein
MRGIVNALKAAGEALHAELRAAANMERRTANAAMREIDCMMRMPWGSTHGIL